MELARSVYRYRNKEVSESIYRASQVALVVKNLPVNAEDPRGEGGEDALEKEMAPHSSILA